MRRIRVLVVDDAVVVRRIVTNALSTDPTIEVVGTAANGRIALGKVEQLRPDVLTLDVEMPEMDGLQTLVELRQVHPNLPVIMFSTLTERGQAVTMDALLKGANDYVTKPANVGSVTEAQKRIQEELIPKIHALCGTTPVTRLASPATAAATRRATSPTPVARPPRLAVPVELVVIGVSTGGPNALSQMLPQLPGDLPVPVAVVQHMPAMFTQLLADRLDTRCALTVREAVDGMPVTAGHVLIAPGDHHLEVARHRTGLVARVHQGPRENSCRPAADVLFRSAAAATGPATLAAVLTGMGDDGRRGAEEIVAAGGRVVVQDRASSVVWGMPGAVTQAGLAEEVLPLERIASTLTTRVAQRTPVGGRATSREVIT